MMAHKIVHELRLLREEGKLSYLRPDAKSQVTIEYDQQNNPVRLHTVVISTQHDEKVSQEQITKDMHILVRKLFPRHFLDEIPSSTSTQPVALSLVGL